MYWAICSSEFVTMCGICITSMCVVNIVWESMMQNFKTFYIFSCIITLTSYTFLPRMAHSGCIWANSQLAVQSPWSYRVDDCWNCRSAFFPLNWCSVWYKMKLGSVSRHWNVLLFKRVFCLTSSRCVNLPQVDSSSWIVGLWTSTTKRGWLVFIEKSIIIIVRCC